MNWVIVAVSALIIWLVLLSACVLDADNRIRDLRKMITRERNNRVYALLEESGKSVNASLLAVRRLESQIAQSSERETRRRRLREEARLRPPRDCETLRRCYHAIRRLHPRCGVKGCDYCSLMSDIGGMVSAHFLMSSNTVSRISDAPAAQSGSKL